MSGRADRPLSAAEPRRHEQDLRRFFPLERARDREPGTLEEQLRALKNLLARHRGSCEALIHLVIPNRSETVIGLPEDLKVAASDEIMDDAEKLFGYNVVTFE